ncbi:MAG TPA: type I restriction enzyme HsdR N-terminal domain-containing protein [Chitinophaga sp.]|uniref:type I restriction enzyme HsdR N-terminal domain-containing protein n=1 Tax=Chitinophaga sp. TaxID=1869181 RepID=UPI002BDEEEC9|nr:type I restriction enzyme HsdR N-terminal domain-containing protein [Chitinophaga sp.]HVI48964.1 type I restriction enzyme HsdR N-terminal domain-containing protein [Chitinophaga sp.]
MIAINFPAPDFKIVNEAGKELIFDRFRKKYVVLTPEEWVRQNFLNYLVKTLLYPQSLIGIEKEILLGEMKKRFDIVIYNREMQPWMLVECKEMNVPLSQQTLEQVVRYNMVIPAAFLTITNGVNTFCCTYSSGQQWRFLEELPGYPERS